MLNIFLCACWPSLCPLWRNVYSDLLPIFWVVCFDTIKNRKQFVTLETSFISHIIFKYFLPSVGCLFVLFIVSFAVQKLLSLSRSYLFIFVFISIILGHRLKKILLWFMSESVLPMFLSKSSIVSSLTFRALLYFELIFVYGVKEWSNFMFFTCSCPVFPAPFVEETAFPTVCSLAYFVIY